jgi:hypothetical protein
LTGADHTFLSKLISDEIIRDPVLELGGGYGGSTCRDLIERSGFKYFATDLHLSHGVDFAANFETGQGIDRVAEHGPYGSILILNVLEHTFDPISVLDTSLALAKEQGILIVITPIIWPIHNFPIDCCRLLPDWYRQYADSRQLILDEATFSYVGIAPVSSFKSSNGEDRLPHPANSRSVYRFWSRAVHKVFNTFGRGMLFPSHIAIGAVFRRP